MPKDFVEDPLDQFKIYNLVEDRPFGSVGKPLEVIDVERKENMNGPPSFKSYEPFNKHPIIIDLDLDFTIKPELNIDIITKIIDKKYIFNPKNYFQDSKYRIIYTSDFKIKLKVNVSILKIDINCINYIMSLSQLLILELIKSEEFEKIVNIVVSALNMKMTYTYKYRRFFFQRKLNNEIVEEINMILTSQDFSHHYSGSVTDLRICYAFEQPIGFGNLGDLGKSDLNY